MATVGKNILDNLTTGMYSDSKVIYREYIQNACDQIDKALSLGIISSNEGNVDIFIDSNKRYISIKDNATGISSSEFVENLGDIANSNKEKGKDKGFRGIGRLCGLAYCKTLKFSTSYLGENIKSIMTCDAQKMRDMLNENKKYSLDEIWDTIVTYSTESANEDEHYFEVELIDISKANTDLLDEVKVREYLSFVAPVPYRNTFYLRSYIYSHAKTLNYSIDEYCIRVNGVQIFKEYTTKLKDQSASGLKNYDEISRLEFKDFYSDSGELIAWMWIGLSRFEKQIPTVNQMRGLRVRSSNIQLGDNNVLRNLFKESRGNYYFVGEVFAVSTDLIPNSQRDYFNENDTRVLFEDLLRTYFYDVLHRLYCEANKYKNDYKRQEEYLTKVSEFQKKDKEGGFISEDERAKFQYDVDKAKEAADIARKRLEKSKNIDSSSPLFEVRKNVEDKYNPNILKEAESTSLDTDEDKKKKYVTSSLSKLSRSERKIVGKILGIITEYAPKPIAEQIIEKIKEELK